MSPRAPQESARFGAAAGAPGQHAGVTTRPVQRWDLSHPAQLPPTPRLDDIAVEEPLEIRVNGRGYAVTMRTPGADRELAAGFAVSEGLISQRHEVVAEPVHPDQPGVINLAMSGTAALIAADRHRHVYTTSSCGVCGLASIDAVQTTSRFDVRTDGSTFECAEVAQWPDLLRMDQVAFDSSGGVHAAGLLAPTGDRMAVSEDVGRHNAVDKAIGAALLDDRLPLVGHVLQVSGRASFELVQKAAMAGIPVLSAVSAPSSLAVDLAQSLGMTLIGFSRGGSFNIYSGHHRVVTRPDLP